MLENGGTGSQQSGTSTSTVSSSTASTLVESPASGLGLSLTLNSTALSAGQAFNATVVETNTGTATLNVSASDDWPIQGLTLGPCGTQNRPIGFAVFSRDYDLSNVSSGKVLQIYNPAVVACPMILSGIGSYEFQPSSDNATVFGSCQPDAAGCFSETVDATLSLDGYWSGSALTPFPAGAYTVVAGDEWGGLAILHFTVAGNQA